MPFDAFSVRDLQLAAHILVVCEGVGVQDLPTARARIAAHLQRTALEQNKTVRSVVERKTRMEQRSRLLSRVQRELLPCPSCGLSQMEPVANSEGLRILGCKRCRYSRILEGTDG